MGRRVIHLGLCEILKNKFKIVRKRASYRMRIFWKYQFRRSDREPCFILASRRTGSNLLLSYLNSIPGTSFAPEVLHSGMYYGIRDKFISKNAAIRHILHSIHHCKHRVCGAKLIRIQMETHRIWPGDLKNLFPQAKFIILYRKSLLEQYLSLKIAEMTNVWVWTKDFKLPDSLTIDPAGFEEHCRLTRAFYSRILAYPGIKESAVILSYEELAGDPQRVFEEKIEPFLKLPETRVRSGMIRQNWKQPEEIIKNYGEIRHLAHEFLKLDFGVGASIVNPCPVVQAVPSFVPLGTWPQKTPLQA